jgi:DegV family protein with EDD domain
MMRIVMDGAGDLPDGWVEKYQIDVIPVNIHFGNQMFLQGVDLTNDQFYKLVTDNNIIPKTSQPSPHQFSEFYQRIAQPGDTILSIHVTQKLSGTFASAEIAAQELAGRYDIYPFDSASGSAAMAYLCQEARLLEEAGASIEAILARLDEIRNQITIFLTLDTLKFAQMSGRVKTLQAALASLLNVKPIVILRDGVLDMGDRVRTRKRSLDKLLELLRDKVGNQVIHAAVVHAQDLATANQLFDEVKRQFKCKQLILTELSIAVAANLGPGTVGIVAYPVKED